MGQILNRAYRVAKSFVKDVDSYFDIDKSNNDELKRIIDELDSDKKNYNTNKQRDKQREKNLSFELNLDEAFKILKILQSAGIDDIKTAYKDRIKEYHPDRLENFGDEIKELARRKTQEINKAYELIKIDRGF